MTLNSTSSSDFFDQWQNLTDLKDKNQLLDDSMILPNFKVVKREKSNLLDRWVFKNTFEDNLERTILRVSQFANHDFCVKGVNNNFWTMDEKEIQKLTKLVPLLNSYIELLSTTTEKERKFKQDLMNKMHHIQNRVFKLVLDQYKFSSLPPVSHPIQNTNPVANPSIVAPTSSHPSFGLPNQQVTVNPSVSSPISNVNHSNPIDPSIHQQLDSKSAELDPGPIESKRINPFQEEEKIKQERSFFSNLWNAFPLGGKDKMAEDDQDYDDIELQVFDPSIEDEDVLPDSIEDSADKAETEPQIDIYDDELEDLEKTITESDLKFDPSIFSQIENFVENSQQELDENLKNLEQEKHQSKSNNDVLNQKLVTDKSVQFQIDEKLFSEHRPIGVTLTLNKELERGEPEEKKAVHINISSYNLKSTNLREITEELDRIKKLLKPDNKKSLSRHLICLQGCRKELLHEIRKEFKDSDYGLKTIGMDNLNESIQLFIYDKNKLEIEEEKFINFNSAPGQKMGYLKFKEKEKQQDFYLLGIDAPFASDKASKQKIEQDIALTMYVVSKKVNSEAPILVVGSMNMSTNQLTRRINTICRNKEQENPFEKAVTDGEPTYINSNGKAVDFDSVFLAPGKANVTCQMNNPL